MSKTIDNVVKIVPKLGLAGLLAMSSGCIGSAIITGYGAQCGQPGAYAFGNALNQTEAAREGKTTVNVYNGGQNQDSPIVYPTSRDNGVVLPGANRQVPLIMVDKKTGKKKVYTTDSAGSKPVLVGENDTLDNENFIHFDEWGGKAIYKRTKNPTSGFESYSMVKYISRDKLSEESNKTSE